MNRSQFKFWTCPGCIHATALSLEHMTNGCRLIDQGESPVDGAAWEYFDRDVCPEYEPRKKQQTVSLD